MDNENILERFANYKSWLVASIVIFLLMQSASWPEGPPPTFLLLFASALLPPFLYLLGIIVISILTGLGLFSYSLFKESTEDTTLLITVIIFLLPVALAIYFHTPLAAGIAAIIYGLFFFGLAVYQGGWATAGIIISVFLIYFLIIS